MFTIFKKEVAVFLSSLIAYIIIGVFLLITGLFLWIFPNFNVLGYGYANLDTFFEMAPWIFMFLIPAITMRSFTEEKRNGTLELLLTKPVTDFQVVLAKFFAGFALVVFSIIPTFLYVITIYLLADPIGNIDLASIMGSYIGLFLLGASFVSIGIFASSISENQIVSFVFSILFSFFFFIAFDSISLLKLPNDVLLLLEQLGINSHYTSLSKGVIDSRDVLYFVSLSGLFVYFTKVKLESRKW